MENHGHHENHNDQHNESKTKLAFDATLHCLLGCGLGEVTGIVIGTALGMDTIPRIILAVSLGFVFGFFLGIRPLLKSGMAFRKAVKIVLIAEGLSIVVMEATEVLVEVYTPGVMQAGLLSGLFWGGMLLALTAGFIAAFPVNLYLVGKGIRHHH